MSAPLLLRFLILSWISAFFNLVLSFLMHMLAYSPRLKLYVHVVSSFCRLGIAQDSMSMDPQELLIQEHSHQPAETKVSYHEITEAHVHSALAVATLDEEEVEFSDLAQPEVLSVLAGLNPKKKHVLAKGATVRERGDDHDFERPVIKRKKCDRDDGEGEGDGMSLRPRDGLRHNTCGTHHR